MKQYQKVFKNPSIANEFFIRLDIENRLEVQIFILCKFNSHSLTNEGNSTRKLFFLTYQNENISFNA